METTLLIIQSYISWKCNVKFYSKNIKNFKTIFNNTSSPQQKQFNRINKLYEISNIN